MPEYDPLILRDQLRGQIEHALAHDATRSPLVRLGHLIEYLESVVADITRWDTHHHCGECGEDLEHVHEVTQGEFEGWCPDHGVVEALTAEHD